MARQDYRITLDFSLHYTVDKEGKPIYGILTQRELHTFVRAAQLAVMNHGNTFDKSAHWDETKIEEI